MGELPKKKISKMTRYALGHERSDCIRLVRSARTSTAAACSRATRTSDECVLENIILYVTRGRPLALLSQHLCLCLRDRRRVVVGVVKPRRALECAAPGTRTTSTNNFQQNLWIRVADENPYWFSTVCFHWICWVHFKSSPSSVTPRAI